MATETVAWWYKNGLFDSDEEARGAFRFARQQWLDGFGGDNCCAWMGLSEKEFDDWYRGDALPPKSKMSAKITSEHNAEGARK